MLDWLNAEDERFNWFKDHISNTNTGDVRIKLDLNDKGEGKSFKNLAAAATYLVNTNSSKLFKSTSWYADFINRVNDAQESMEELLKDVIASKLEKQEELRKDIPEDVLGNGYKELKISPSVEHNEMDRLFLTGIVYCEADKQFYLMEDNCYTALGTAEVMRDKRALDEFVVKQRYRLGYEFYKTDKRFELWQKIHEVETFATDEYFETKAIVAEAKQKNEYPDKPFVFMNDKYDNLQTFISRNKLYYDNWTDILHTVVLKHVVDHDLPATLFTRSLVNPLRAMRNGFFNGYKLDPNGKQCSLAEFYSELFSTSITDIVPHIMNIPHICSESETVPAKYHLKSNWKDALTDQKDLKDCLAVNAFLEPYTEDERTMLMSWAYTVLHPSCKNGIGLLIKTGGGSFKTSTYAGSIKKLLDIMYGLCYYTVVGGAWTTNDQLCEASNGGFSTSEFIFNDECTENCILKYKDMSGGIGGEGIDYTFKKVYQVPVNTKIYAKFLFCTNKAFTITDAQGVYDRRLAIIDRMDIKKLPYPYPNTSDVERELSRELMGFYTLAEDYYNKVIKDYGSVEAFARQSSIADNLKAVYDESAKIIAYNDLFEQLKTMAGSTDVQMFEHKNLVDKSTYTQINVTVKAIKDLLTKLSEEYDLNAKGLKNYLLEADTKLKNDGPKAIKINEKTRYGYMLYEPVKQD